MVTRAGEAIKLKAIFKSYRDAFRAGQLDDYFYTVAVAAASDDNAVKCASGG
jgi:hypothetical protein